MRKKAALALIGLFLSSLLSLSTTPIKAQSPSNIQILADASIGLADFTAKDLAPLFLSDVVGLDLTKYNITKVGYNSEYPSSFGGQVKEEVVSFELISGLGSINDLSVNGIFLNGFISLSLEQYRSSAVRSSAIYLQEPSTNAVDEAGNILLRYKTFSQKLGWNTSHIDQAYVMLSNVSAAPSKENLSMFNNLAGFVPYVAYWGNMKLVVSEDSADWIYTEEGYDMPAKSLSIDFGLDTLSFSDTWNLYKVGSLNVISEDEAKSIGWEAAKNYTIPFTYENGTTVAMKPKWSNVYEIEISMGHYNMAPDFPVDPGGVNREPLSLYPRWNMLFYFESIGGLGGVQVCVWGDTKEIAYVRLYGAHGFPPFETPGTSPTPEPQPESTPTASPEDLAEASAWSTLPPTDKPHENQDPTSTEPSPEATQSENPSQTGSSNPSANMFLVGGMVAAVAAAIAVASAVLKKRRK